MTTYIVTQGIQGPEGPQGATGPAGSGGGGGPIFARITPSYEPDFATADTVLTAAFGGIYDVEPFAETSVLDPSALRLVLPAEDQQGKTYAVAFPLSGILSTYAVDEVIYGARLTSSMEVPDATAVTVSIADAGGLLPGKMGLFDDGLTYVADDGLVPGSALATAGAAALLDEPIHEAATAASSYVVVTFNYNPAESNSEPLEWEGAIELLTVQGHPGSAWLSDGGGGAAAPEVFRSDFYVGMPFADINGSPSITDGVLTWIEMAGSEHPLRIMLDDPVLGADRGIWIANEDLLNPGTNDGTFTFAPTEQQPYASLANSGLIGSFGFNVATFAYATGRVQYLTGSSVWEFRDFQTYLNADSDNWPGNDPATFSQALDQLAAAGPYQTVGFDFYTIPETTFPLELSGQARTIVIAAPEGSEVSFRPATLTDVGQRWHIYSPLASTVVVTGEGPVTVPAGHVLVVFGFTADGIDAIWVQGELQSQSSGGGGLHASNVNVGAFTGILNTATPPATVQEALDIVDGLEPVQSDGTILDIVKLTQAAYDLLTPVSTTLYVIVG